MKKKDGQKKGLNLVPYGKMSLMTGCAQIVVQEKTILKWSNFDDSP